MTPADVDACLGVLADGRRRLLGVLRQETTGPTTFDELARRLREERSATDRESAPSHDQVRPQLTHVHLPKLAAHGVVEYDPAADTVRYRPHGTVEAILDALPAESPRLSG